MRKNLLNWWPLWLLCGLVVWSVEGCGGDSQCSNNADCQGGKICRQTNGKGVCVDPNASPCQSKTDCTAPQAQCDLLRNVCVECLDDSHCSGTKLCKNKVCAEPNACQSNTDCAAPTAVCSFSLGKCVGCVGNNDCTNGQVCTNSQCTTPSSETTAESTSEPQAEPQTEPTSEPRTEPSSEPQTEPASEPQTEPTPDPQTEPTPETTAEINPEAGPESEMIAEINPEAGPESEPFAEISPEAGPESEMIAEITPEAGSESEPFAEITPEQPPCTPGSVGCACATGSQCTAGAVCISLGNGQGEFCYQDCTQSRGSCALNVDGRTTCIDFANDGQGNTIAVCLKEVLKNQTCDLAQGTLCKRNQSPALYCSQTLAPKTCLEAQVQTTVGADCNGPNDGTEPIKICDPQKQSDGTYLVCRNQKCAKEQPAARHGACGGNNPVCDAADTCLQLSQDTPAYCFERCTTPGQPCANGKGNCEPMQSGGGACVYGDAKEDELCGPIANTPTRYDVAKVCGTGLTCISFDSNTIVGACLRSVSGCTPSTICGTGRTCLPLQSGGAVCGKQCTTTASCGTNFTCASLGGTFGSVCAPVDKGGILPYGAICDPGSVIDTTRCCNGSLQQSACTAGGRSDYSGLCLRRDANSTSGFCSADCDPLFPNCPPFGGNATRCVSSGTGGFCVIPCTSTANCPTGLSCVNQTGIGQICVAP